MTTNPEATRLGTTRSRSVEEHTAAAAEAGSIGGRRPDYPGDEERRAVEEGGGGVAEGFEERRSAS